MARRKADGNLFAMRKDSFSARTVAKCRQSRGADRTRSGRIQKQLRALGCGLLPRGKLTFVNVKRLKCASSFFLPYLVEDSDFVDDR
jgi:hypothetical protein